MKGYRLEFRVFDTTDFWRNGVRIANFMPQEDGDWVREYWPGGERRTSNCLEDLIREVATAIGCGNYFDGAEGDDVSQQEKDFFPNADRKGGEPPVAPGDGAVSS